MIAVVTFLGTEGIVTVIDLRGRRKNSRRLSFNLVSGKQLEQTKQGPNITWCLIADEKLIENSAASVLAFLLAVPASGLSNLRVSIPETVQRGADVVFNCSFNLRDERLYAIKWYRGNREIFRFIPSENPPNKPVPLEGLNISVSRLARLKSNMKFLTFFQMSPYLHRSKSALSHNAAISRDVKKIILHWRHQLNSFRILPSTENNTLSRKRPASTVSAGFLSFF